MNKKARYITTTIAYVNADPHIGFGYEIVSADVFARYWRRLGYEVFFNTGTDEHGQKIAQKADEAGQERQKYVDYYASEYARLKTKLNLSYDNFIRTTDPHHKAAAAAIWRRCEANGDIYKKKYSGLYCVGCELFYQEAELEAGKVCPIHTKPCQEVTEENYFFRLSNYQDYLKDYLSRVGVIEPEWRRQEAINFVAKGLEDFSISRERARLDWGVPVPGDDRQVMYVWFDALTNYISALGWPEAGGAFAKFWTDGEVNQVAGKDQVRFQSIMWQAMLKSAGVKATDRVIYHGFITSGGQKMSKSLGNTISPYDLIARYGTDATRYLLLRYVHPFDDTDITLEKLDGWYTADLVNGLGNLTARILKMSESYGLPHKSQPREYFDEETISNFNQQATLTKIWTEISSLDEYIQKEEPFKKIKVDKVAAAKDIDYLLSGLENIAGQLTIFMPESAELILRAIADNKKPDNLFPRLT